MTFFIHTCAYAEYCFLCLCLLNDLDGVWVLMVKSIRKFIYEDFLAAIDTKNKVFNHSKGFYMFFSIYRTPQNSKNHKNQVKSEKICIYQNFVVPLQQILMQRRLL